MDPPVRHHDVGASMQSTTVGLMAGRLCALWKRVDVGASRRDRQASMEASRRAVGKEAWRHAGKVERRAKGRSKERREVGNK